MDLIRWGMTFWKKANARNVEDSAPHLNNLLHLSRDLMNDLKRDLPDSFDMIEKGVAVGSPKYMEWYGAFGLIVTIVWLYLEILRLLGKLNSRD